MPSASGMTSRARRHASSRWCRASPNCCSTSALPRRSSGAPASACTPRIASSACPRSGGPRASRWRASSASRPHTWSSISTRTPAAAVEELAKFVPHVVVTHPLGSKGQPAVVSPAGRNLFARGAGRGIVPPVRAKLCGDGVGGGELAAPEGAVSDLEVALDDGGEGYLHLAHAGDRRLGQLRGEE